MAARFVTHGEDGRTELMADGIEVVDVACTQARTKGNRDSEKRFVERHGNKVSGHEVCHAKLNASFGQVAPEASKGGIALIACGQTNSNGGKTEDFTELEVGEHYVLLDVLGEICESDVASALYVAVLPEETATADRSGSTVEKEERVYGEAGFH